MWDRKAERIAKYKRKKERLPRKQKDQGVKVQSNESDQDRRTGLLRDKN